MREIKDLLEGGRDDEEEDVMLTRRTLAILMSSQWGEECVNPLGMEETGGMKERSRRSTGSSCPLGGSREEACPVAGTHVSEAVWHSWRSLLPRLLWPPQPL